jgi:hypothetical protein
MNHWVQMLLIEQYVYNNSQYSSTVIEPWYTNYGLQSRSNLPSDIQKRNLAWDMFGHYKTETFAKLCCPLGKIKAAKGKYYHHRMKAWIVFRKGE